MEVVIAMGHFCENHGPVVILCTDREYKVPDTPAKSVLNSSVCAACESIETDSIYVCEDKDTYYVSTRTSQKESLARLLKDAVVRALSIEYVQQEGHDQGTMYFGGDTGGHIIAHVFDVKDSLARGFKRKYCFIVVGKDRIPLMQHYWFIEEKLNEISKDLQDKACKINEAEQAQCSQKDFRRAQGTSSKSTRPVLRSLSALVGETYVFAHLHMWFVWLLRAKLYEAVPYKVPECPVDCPTPKELRDLQKEMPEEVFQTVCYCILVGIKIEEENVEVVKHFRQLLPKGFVLPTSGQVCKVSKADGVWTATFKGTLPKRLPTFQTLVEESLKNEIFNETALKYHLMSHSMRWFNIACVLSWAPGSCPDLVKALDVRPCDTPLLSYWVPQSNACVKLNENNFFDDDEENQETFMEEYGFDEQEGVKT